MKKLIKLKCFLIVFSIALCGTKGHAQTFRTTLFGARQGLPYSKLNDLLVDTSGFIWLATDVGLIKYDGSKSQIEKEGVFEKLVPIKNGQNIAIGPETLIPFGVFENNTQSWVDLIKQQGISTKSIIDIQFDSIHQRLWILSDHALFKIEQNQIKKIKSELNISYKESLLCISRNGSFQLITPLQIYQYIDDSAEPLKPNTRTSFHQLKQVLPLNDSLNLILDSGGVFEFNPFTTSVSKPTWSGLPSDINISGISTYRDRILIGTQAHGLWLGKQYPTAIKFRNVKESSEPNRPTELPFKQVKKIHWYGDENVWVITPTNLSLLSELPFKRISDDIPMASFDQMGFLDNGKIYLGSDHGIYEGIPLGLHDFSGRIAFFLSNNMSSSLATYKNRLWVASLNNKIYYYENGAQSKSIDLSYRGNFIFLMVPDKKGNIWVMQAPAQNPIIGTLKITSDLEIKEYGHDQGFQNRILSAVDSPFGFFCVGIGEQSYLYQYDSIKDRFINLSVEMNFDYGDNFEVHDLAIGMDTTIWLASTAGLLRYHKSKIEKIYFPELYQNEVVGVAVANDGAVWFSTDRSGVVRYQDGRYVIYDVRAGFSSSAMSYRSILAKEDGTIWVGTREGMFISPTYSHTWRKTKPPQIFKIYEQNKITQRNSFPFNTSIKLEFASLTHPVEPIQYSYRVPGYLDSWMILAKGDTLSLRNLKSGDYTLEIKAKQAGGYEWSNPTIYEFTIQKKWYYKPGAYIAFIFILALLVFAGVRVYNKRLLIEKIILERRVAERTNQIASKNEEILAQMEELKLLSDQIANQRDSIESQRLLLKHANEDLEQRVHERTDELSRTNQELLTQNLQLEQFAFMTAHNLRGPVARLLGLTHIFNLQDPSYENNKKIIQKIQSSASALDEVIRDISEILQVKKSLHHTFELINAYDIMEQVLGSSQEEIIQRKIHVTNNIDRSLELPGILPYVQSIFYNIINNAIKYSDPEKESFITIQSFKNNDSLQIVIADNGIGFDSHSLQDKMFKPFSRLTLHGEGKGLGLYLVKIEMESIKGSIDISSQAQVGTKVVLNFPIHPDSK